MNTEKVIETAQIDPDTGYITNIDAIRVAQYPSLEHTTYLDHAGTTLYPKSLIEAFSTDLTHNLFGNPHSASASSQLSSQRIDDVRLRVLRFFNADPDHFDVVFTANATAAIKLVAEAFREHAEGFDYAYHIDSHTSLVGVRELTSSSRCLLRNEDVAEWLACDAGRSNPKPRLLAYPGQSNMTGKRISLEWSQQVNQLRDYGCKNLYTLWDVASLASTAPIDLSNPTTAPAFTSVSFYKIFGFPDLGALIVRKDSADVLLGRKYFGGGTVEGVAVVGEPWHAIKDKSIPDRLEDGTLPFHSIIALGHALRIHGGIYGCMQNVANHTKHLASQLRAQMKSLRHGNGKSACILYGVDDQGTESGPLIAFNLLDNAGNYVSNAEVEKMAYVRKIDLRTGGLCNPGGTSTCLGLQPDDLRQNYAMGHRCGSPNDLINGRPTGTIRVSFGAMSSRKDAQALLDFLQEFFVDPTPLAQEPVEVVRTTTAPGRGRFVVESLTVFPIKSCAAFNVPSDMSWSVGPRGLAWDREWCLVHEGTHQALSQKKYPRMALLRPTIDLSRRMLHIAHNIQGSGWQHLEVSLDEAPTTTSTVDMCGTPTLRRTSSVCGESVDIEHYTSPEVSRYFTNALGVPCTLARFPQSGVTRQPQIRSQTGVAPANVVPPSHSIALSNESPILLVSRSSVNRLNEQIKARGASKWGKTVPAESFRGNIIVSEELKRGQSESPYAEDEWTQLTIGSGGEESTFQVMGPCQRCQMVCIDQGDASRRQEPFSTLAKTRKKEGKVWFGMHMSLLPGSDGVLKVGDHVQAQSR